MKLARVGNGAQAIVLQVRTGGDPQLNKAALLLKPASSAATRGMVRDFIYGCWCNGRRIGGMEMPPLNELYVATHARQPGISVQFLDAQIEPDRYKGLVSNKFKDIGVILIMSSTQSFRDDTAVSEA